MNNKHGHPISPEQGQRFDPNIPARFLLKGNRPGEALRTWLDVYVNSMHLSACSQQLPLAPERLRRTWSETVVNGLASKTSRSCSTSSKTPVKAGSLSSICGSTVGFPSQCPATHCHQWFHAEQSATRLSEAIANKCFSQPGSSSIMFCFLECVGEVEEIVGS